MLSTGAGVAISVVVFAWTLRRFWFPWESIPQSYQPELLSEAERTLTLIELAKGSLAVLGAMLFTVLFVTGIPLVYKQRWDLVTMSRVLGTGLLMGLVLTWVLVYDVRFQKCLNRLLNRLP
jgi:hypothetical protein